MIIPRNGIVLPAASVGAGIFEACRTVLLQMASGNSNPIVGALLRYSSVTVIIVLDAELGVE